MAEEIQFIVNRLNAEPFNMKLSLVTFDAHSDAELLQVLNDVFAKLDERNKVDLRDEDPAVTGPRLMNFLRIVKFNVPAAERESFQQGLLAGNRKVIYPILHHVLSRFVQLQKRAYVARFLVNVEVPAEFMHDDVMQDVHQQYKVLQEEFKETHRTVDRLRGNNFNPGELKREITQLEEEKLQLTEKISTLKRKTTGVDGFEDLLEATSSLRREQEEETKLAERLVEQRMAAQGADKRFFETQRRLNETRANMKDDVSAQQLLEAARREAHDMYKASHETLPQMLGQRHETMNRLQALLSEPPKSDEDVAELRSAVQQAEHEVEELTARITAASKASGDDKLARFRHQSALISKKLQQKEAALEDAEREREALAREIEDKEARMSEMAGPKFMGREEFKQYATKLRNKTNKFKKLKAELNEIRDETVVLGRTVQVLRGADASLGDFLAKLESERGISGYTETQTRLEKLSKETAQLDQTKGKTLEEISNIVTDINVALNARKNKLAPQIKELRAVRQRYQELEATYVDQKNKYDNTKAGLESHQMRLLQECNKLQEECLREESRYHYLNCLSGMANAQLQRVEQESRCERGEDELLRDFKSWKAVYTHKVQQQEQYAKELRKRQKAIKENEGPNMEQRAMFADLKKILACKLEMHKKAAGEHEKADAVNIAAFDTLEIGGANVMTIDQ